MHQSSTMNTTEKDTQFSYYHMEFMKEKCNLDMSLQETSVHVVIAHT